MKYIWRSITQTLLDYTKLFPVVFLTGPRQSGKSTLLKYVFPDHAYRNLEEKDLREFALADPRGFLTDAGMPAIIDEAQYAPDLFSYIQSLVDDQDEPGRFILSGSQNFLMLKSISQSLAGRVGLLSLLPFSDNEAAPSLQVPTDTNEWMFTGHYPRVLARGLAPSAFYPNYIKTYIERDVRSETGVRDLDRFMSFLNICALNTGSPINLASIGNAVQTDARTVASWLNILEESYIIFRLRPYGAKNVRRYTKKQKLYFFDTGLLCNLIGFRSPADLTRHKMRGMLFENAVIAEFYKNAYNSGKFPGSYTYFWRDSSNRDKEVDFIIEDPDRLRLFEVKSSQTAKSKFADNLFLFERNSNIERCEKTVIYDGQNNMTINGAHFINHKELSFE
jgi:predicted AAA+ superfamily ATPase